MIKRYRHRPIEVEAEQFNTGSKVDIVRPYSGKEINQCKVCGLYLSQHGEILMPNRQLGLVCPGTYLIRSGGMMTFWEKERFEASFEEVVEERIEGEGKGN